MLPRTPYKVTLNALFFDVHNLYIELMRFIDPITTFKDNTYPTVLATGKYTDTQFYKSANIRLEVVISPTIDTDASLKFIGSFSVESQSALNVQRTCVILTQYVFDIIKDYIVDKPLVDKDGNLFVMPYFSYADQHFKDVVFI